MGGCGTDACQPKFYDSLGKQVQCEYEALYCTFIMMKFREKDMHLKQQQQQQKSHELDTLPKNLQIDR